MKIAGLGSSALPVPKWYLLLAEEATFRNVGAKNEKLEIKFVVEKGPHAGHLIVDDFLLGAKSVSRLRKFLSCGGYPKELLEQDELDDAKVPGLRVWAKVIEDNYGLKTEGWNFRAADDAPDEEKSVDYSAKDAEEAAAAVVPAGGVDDTL